MSFIIIYMIIEHASVYKITDGRTAIWRFVEMDGTFAAIGDNRKIHGCNNIDELRGMYRRYVNRYGFRPVVNKSDVTDIVPVSVTV